MNDQDDLRKLVGLMERCQQDTRDKLGPGQAGRLAHWQAHQDNLSELLSFIKRCLRNSQMNGAELHSKSGLSLEAIVTRHLPHRFEPEDRELAEATLKLGESL